ncbi:hypothetical protein D915_002810 [Fasciola hepatica]|uniref:CUB domain-containing protein n=1 Tax=Fasciola hepatica TaxID=6192 RepID=A0A4E0RX42_FASHE|nr:hypothetical protein D915_002810 [Fasciola hepatica]
MVNECNTKYTTYTASETVYSLKLGRGGAILPSSFNCNYQIQAADVKVVEATFKDFTIGNTKQCGTEYVLVRTAEKPDIEDRKYCGSDIPTVMEIKSTVYVQIRGENFAEVDQL